ncbi:MAG TPA: bifunctional oligoribonuclease/PAP phosphatase NrnA [Spirochaetia bacterium]|nr:bifunctional oligoribonuclease/PAP phosphatase NrnA [Spirochaetia bacterium]
MATLAEVAGVLRGTDDAFVCGHVMPDGDALGSALALGWALEQLGKRVTVASPDPVPELYSFLPGVERLVTNGAGLSGHTAFVMVDCSVPARLGVYEEALKTESFGLVVNIDHHRPAGEPTAGLSYIDPGAAATGEIVFDLIELLGVPLTKDAATCLYTAIVTDTGSFEYESTSAGTHRRAARLIEAGVSVAAVNSCLYEEKPVASLLLLQRALGSLAFAAGGRVAFLSVTLADLAAVGARDEHTEGLINYARFVRGVEVAILFRETEPGRFKVGLRSKHRVDVQAVAALFGGGGHIRAAGCLLDGTLAEVQGRVLEAAERVVS